MRKLLRFICAVLALVLALCIGATVFINRALKKISRTEDASAAVSIDNIKLLQEDKYNILLVGQDRREGQERQRADCILLCTVDKTSGTLTMTSFMRDTYVSIPDYGESRINTAYEVGGFPMLYATLRENFDVQVDYGIEVDFDGFISIIDTLGGVELELTAKEAEYLNSRGNWDVTNDTDWTLQEGTNLLTGSQALAYSRIRAIGNDFARTGRQRLVLTKIIERLKTENAISLTTLLEKALPMVTTDMSDGEIIAMAVWVIPQLKSLQVVSQRIPGDGMYSDVTIKGAMVLKPDLDACKELLKETIGDTQ